MTLSSSPAFPTTNRTREFSGNCTVRNHSQTEALGTVSLKLRSGGERTQIENWQLLRLGLLEQLPGTAVTRKPQWHEWPVRVTGEHLPSAGLQQITPEGESPGLPVLTGQSSKGQFSFLASPGALVGQVHFQWYHARPLSQRSHIYV